MANNMSQNDVDALVQSLLVGANKASPAPGPEQRAAPDSQPSGQEASGPAAEADFLPEFVDLGPIEQSEVDAALAAHRAKKEATDSEALRRAKAAVSAQAAAADLDPGQKLDPVAAAFAEVAASRPVPHPPLSGVLAPSILLDVALTLTVELGRVRMPLKQILTLGPGSVLTLDHLAAAPVAVLINNIPVMKAEVVVIGENYGIRMTEVNLGINKAS